MGRTTENIKSFVTGDISHDQLTESERSVLRFWVYKVACRVLAMSQDKRKQATANMPEGFKNLVRLECIRLIKIRGKG